MQSVEIKVDASNGVNRIIKGLDKSLQKDAVNLLADMFMEEVNKYVPEDSGALKRGGYVLRTYSPKGKVAWFKVTYRNTKALPYVMYQYNGVVYGPNFAQFDSAGNQIPGAWKSGKKPKHPNNKYPLGTKRTVTLKDGRVIHIEGYKNPNSKPGWLEYVRKTPTVWYPLRRKMLNEMKEFVRQGLNNG